MFAPLPHTSRRLVVGIDARIGGLIATVDVDTGETLETARLTGHPMQLILLIAEVMPKLVVIQRGSELAAVVRVMRATRTPFATATLAREPAALRRLLRPA